MKKQGRQFNSLARSCLTLCNPMDCSMPGLPVHHQLPEFTQTHVHWVSDAIQPSHPLLSLSPTFNLSQHHGLFKWVSSSHQVAKVLEFQLQHQSFQWIFRTDLLKDGLVGSPCSPRDSQESSPTPQFKSINSSALSFLSSPILTSIYDFKTIALTRWTFVGKVMSLLFNILSRLDFPGGSDGKASAYNVGDLGSIPGSGRSPGEGNGNPLQDSCLENPMDRRAW